MAPRRSGTGCPKEQRDKNISANAQRRGYQHHHPSSSTSSAMSIVGCGVNIETGDEAINCIGFADNKEENIQRKSYQLFFDGTVSEMSEVAKELIRRLKVRDKLLEGLP